MGAVMAGLVADIPQLVWLSRHKAAVFAGAGLLLLAAGAMLWHARHRPCPANPAQARACTRLRRISMGVYALSILLFAVGLFFAYGAGLVWG